MSIFHCWQATTIHLEKKNLFVNAENILTARPAWISSLVMLWSLLASKFRKRSISRRFCWRMCSNKTRRGLKSSMDCPRSLRAAGFFRKSPCLIFNSPFSINSHAFVLKCPSIGMSCDERIKRCYSYFCLRERESIRIYTDSLIINFQIMLGEFFLILLR